MPLRPNPFPRISLPAFAGKTPAARAGRINGFLLIELLVGMVIVAIVMLALSSVLFTVAQGWDDQDVSQSTQVQANQLYAKVQSYLSAAKCVTLASAGPTSGGVIFWRADDDQDGLIEEGELGLIIQDPATHSLYLYRSMLPYAGQAATTCTLSQFTAAQIEAFPFIQKQTLGGPGSEPDDGTRLDINGFQLYLQQAPTDGSQLPIVEFTLTLSKDGQNLTLYNSSTLRPSTQPQ
jgi:type II secretory pathway pseudopilin PulG